jgi:hypothetical protein
LRAHFLELLDLRFERRGQGCDLTAVLLGLRLHSLESRTPEASSSNCIPLDRTNRFGGVAVGIVTPKSCAKIQKLSIGSRSSSILSRNARSFERRSSKRERPWLCWSSIRVRFCVSSRELVGLSASAVFVLGSGRKKFRRRKIQLSSWARVGKTIPQWNRFCPGPRIVGVGTMTRLFRAVPFVHVVSVSLWDFLFSRKLLFSQIFIDANRINALSA